MKESANFLMIFSTHNKLRKATKWDGVDYTLCQLLFARGRY